MRNDFETLKLERVGDHVLLVTLNRPEVLNATNTVMGRERLELFGGLYVDQEDVRCIVLMHLSRVNNVPELAELTCREALAACGREDVRVVVTSQDKVTPPVDLETWAEPHVMAS